MSTDYNGVLERLREERIAHNMSQEELGVLVRITQGHYSKVENAVKRFTYFELKSLAETELDLYYIYTGKRTDERYLELFDNCSYKELRCYLGMAASLLTCMYEERKLGLDRDYYDRLCFVKYLAGAVENADDNIFCLLRQFRKKTQSEMAGQLGMDIKKYRQLEQGSILPDSELTWRLCSAYGIPPAFVVSEANGLAGEIGELLDRLETGKNGAVFKYFRLLRDYYMTRS